MNSTSPDTQATQTRPAIQRFDLIAAILVSLTVGFSTGKIWARADVHVLDVWQRYRATTMISDYVSSHPIRKLQIAAGGNNLEGWLNTDIKPTTGQAYLDATKTFPLADRSFRYIFGEQVIEHLTYQDGLAMLRECYRVLEPGGKLRIETPNLMKFIALFDAEKSEDLRHYEDAKIKWHSWTPIITPECLILNLQLISWGHQFVYDPLTLRASLARAGFQQIKEQAPGASDDPQLRGVGLRHRRTIAPISDYETMAVEATRP